MKLLISKLLISLLVLFGANSHSQQPKELTGKWEVIQLGQQTLNEKYRPTITFLDDGKIEGSTGCNKYNANLTYAGQKMEISAVISSRRACALDNVMMQERDFLKAIKAVAQFEKNNDTEATFYNQNKEQLLQLKKIA